MESRRYKESEHGWRCEKPMSGRAGNTNVLWMTEKNSFPYLVDVGSSSGREALVLGPMRGFLWASDLTTTGVWAILQHGLGRSSCWSIFFTTDPNAVGFESICHVCSYDKSRLGYALCHVTMAHVFKL